MTSRKPTSRSFIERFDPKDLEPMAQLGLRPGAIRALTVIRGEYVYNGLNWRIIKRADTDLDGTLDRQRIDEVVNTRRVFGFSIHLLVAVSEGGCQRCQDDFLDRLH